MKIKNNNGKKAKTIIAKIGRVKIVIFRKLNSVDTVYLKETEITLAEVSTLFGGIILSNCILKLSGLYNIMGGIISNAILPFLLGILSVKIVGFFYNKEDK